MIYLVPDTGKMDVLVEQITRAGIPFHNPKNAREFILATEHEAIAVVAAGEDLMLVLSRHAPSFFPRELPCALLSVPGLIYQAGWASMATVFPPAHFKEFTEATKRSGVLATDAEGVADRDRGALLIDTRGRSSMSEPRDDINENEGVISREDDEYHDDPEA